PIYGRALDAAGNLWATTGGGPLLQLDPATGAILGQYGDGLTQTLAVEPAIGVVYVSSGNGIEVFDPATHVFHHFSDTRVGSLAFAQDGRLWAASWPHNENTVLRFDAHGRPEVMLRLNAAVDSLEFGMPGGQLEGLLFLSHD